MKETILNQDYKLEVVANMNKYGGSFVKALAEAILRADTINLMKIENAFEEYIDQYNPKNWIKG